MRRRIPSRRRGVALVIVLIVIIFGSFLVLISFNMAENLFSTTQATQEHLKLYNAAQHGQEMGKAWLAEKLSREIIPSGGDPVGSASSIRKAQTLKDVDGDGMDVFFPDVVVSADGEYGLFKRDILGNIDIYVVIYDALKTPADAAFGPSDEAPPRMADREISIGQGSAKQGQSYAGSNRGGTGGINESSALVVLPAYVIRSRASEGDRAFGIEGGYRLEP